MTAEKNGKAFRYKKLAEEIASKISNGTYRPGEKLPSIRKLHRDSKLSISTVYQAYAELEKTGLIEARPKSGYYVSPVSLESLKAPRHPRGSSRPTRVNLDAMINSVVSAINNPDLLPLGSSTTSPELLPHRRFSAILKTLSPRKIRSLMPYALAEGDLELRRQIARGTVGVLGGITPNEIMITNGCMEAVFLSLMAVTRPGDTIAVESPTLFGFFQLIRELGLFVIEVPTDPVTGLSVEALEKLLSSVNIKALLLIPNFHNPLGALMPDEKKERLVRLLEGREIPIIEDDICSELYYGSRRPSCLGSFDKRGMVITCSSFSKTVSPGIRVGWVIAGRAFMEKLQRLKAGTTISTSTLDQHLVTEFIKSGNPGRHLRSLRAALKKQTVRSALAVQKYFPEGTRLAPPKGGNLLWVELPEGCSGLDVYEKALERSISILPGIVCSNSGEFTNHIRIGCGFPFTEATEKGFRTLGELVARAN